MWLQIFLIVLAYIFYKNYDTLNQGNIKVNDNRKSFTIVLSILCILQSGLRHVAVGADTYAYKTMYEDACRQTWVQVFATLKEVYVLGEGRDAGYLVFEKLSSYVCIDYQMYLFLVAVIFFVPLWRLLYKNTTRTIDLFYAFVLYQALFYEFFSITGIRQTIATGLCLWAFEYIKQRKLFPYLTCIALGFFIHKSCLLFLPYYWISKLKKTYILYLLCFISLPIMFKIGRLFMLELIAISKTETYMQYVEESTSGAYMLSFFYIGMTLLLFFKYLNNKEFLNERRYVTNALSIGLFLLPLTFVSAALTRMMQYYSIFFLVALSYYMPVQKMNTKWKYIMTFIIIILLYKIYKSDYEYAFFWQSMSLGDNY